MEILTLFLMIMTGLICAAVAVAAFGFRQTTFEEAVAAESRSGASRTTKTGNRSPRASGHRTKNKTAAEDIRTVMGILITPPPAGGVRSIVLSHVCVSV